MTKSCLNFDSLQKHVSSVCGLFFALSKSRILAGVLFLQLFAGDCLAQDYSGNIKGKVTDERGVPFAGVSVVVKGSADGTVTGTDGQFRLAVPDSFSILIFTYIGYTTVEEPVGDRRTINVVLEQQITDLDDVVVIGYGTKKRMHLTGVVSTVDTKLLENRPVSNVLNALQGAAPGLIITRNNGQPGKEGWSANIRGFSSLNGNNNPLIIIDGIEGDPALLNPDDILSVSVLKDAAATAIYGAKSSGGVIIITTKHGDAGRIKVNYTGLYAVKDAYNIPERLHSWEEAEFINVAVENVLGIPDLIPEQMMNWLKDPDTNFIVNPANPSIIGYYYDLNQVPLVMRNTTAGQNHSISLSGGNQKTQYLFSMGYYTSEGVFRFGPDGTSRYNARLNFKTQFDPVFSLDSRISYTNSETEASAAGVNGDFGLLYNIYQLRTLNPVFLPGSNDTKYAFTAGGSTTYPILKEGGYDKLSEKAFNGVFTLKAENFIKGFALRAIYSPRLVQTNQDNFIRTIPLWGFDQSGEPVITSYINPVNSSTKLRSTQISNDLQALADYDLPVGSAHHFHLLGGFQYQHYNFDGIATYARALISNDLPSLNLGGNPAAPPVVADNIQNNTWVSCFGRFNYDFNNKYLFEFTLRRDLSSRLAPAYRAQNFPSVSAGWILSKEPWIGRIPVINHFKLRASWGRLGNAQLGTLYQNNYNYIAQLTNGPAYPFNNVINNSLYQSALPSFELGWEKIETINGGVDLVLLNNRLAASFDYFRRENNNMLIGVNVPAVLGVATGTSNAASMETWGWEAAVEWKEKINELNYSVAFNIGDNQNRITKYLGQVIYHEGLNVAIPGMPINSILGFVSEGYFNSKEDVEANPFQDNRTGPGDIRYQDINEDGKVNSGIQNAEDHGDLVYLGNTSPRYNFGMKFFIGWKGFDLSIFLQGTGERRMMIYAPAVVPFADTWRQPTAMNKDYWTPENPDARFPRLYLGGTHNTRISTHWLQDAAYLRVKSLQAGYTLPSNVTGKLKIERVRIFITGEDVWETSKMWLKYYNPENPNNASFNYPFFRSYSAGINLSF